MTISQFKKYFDTLLQYNSFVVLCISFYAFRDIIRRGVRGPHQTVPVVRDTKEGPLLLLV